MLETKLPIDPLLMKGLSLEPKAAYLNDDISESKSESFTLTKEHEGVMQEEAALLMNINSVSALFQKGLDLAMIETERAEEEKAEEKNWK